MSLYFIYTLIICLSLFSVSGQTFYVSSTGNDNNSGLSQKNAWRTLDKINHLTIKSGSRIFLGGGSSFKGNLLLDESDGGDQNNRIIISSFGKGKAIIDAGESTGIFVHNTSGINISKIIIKGNGVSKNKGSGIHFFADKKSGLYSGITIQNCDVMGFHFYGIFIQSDKDTACGFNDVRIVNCTATENGEAGIASLSMYPAIPHRNFVILKCKAFNNPGILTKTDNHSGNGIVLSGIDNFLIDSCEAYENGADCRSTGGGPVGVWSWNSKNGIIQNSVSHNNHAGTCPHDGGGFDIDGGSSNCTIRNCISYENEGAGYLICEFGSPLPYKNNFIINNISRNDGLKNGYGSITISGAGSRYPVANTVISNNSIAVKNNAKLIAIPAAIYFTNTDFSQIVFENNVFEVGAGAFVLRSDSLFSSGQVVFNNNQFKIDDKKFKVQCIKCEKENEPLWEEILQKKN